MNLSRPVNCEMCGHVTFTVESLRYKYDSGEEFQADVCPVCVRTHKKLAEVK